MRSDALVSFQPIGVPLSLVAGAGIDIPSLNIYDILGMGVGVAPNSIIGNAALFGSDVGIGGKRPELNVSIGTALATATSATLNVAFQAAADLGVSGGYQPDTWQTLVETGELTAAQCTAGQIVARFPFLPAFPASLRPRYLRLLFQVNPSTGIFTAGTIASAIVTTVRDDQANRFQPANYSVR